MDDSISAFPWQEHPEAIRGEAGMSLRDWFAGQALQVLIASGPYAGR